MTLYLLGSQGRPSQKTKCEERFFGATRRKFFPSLSVAEPGSAEPEKQIPRQKDFPLYGIKQDVWRFNWRNFRTGERIEYAR